MTKTEENHDVRTVTLEDPIERGDAKITSLDLRRPRGGALKGIGIMGLAQLEYDEVRKLLPRISSPTLTPADVDKMDPADILACGVEIATFLAGRKASTDFPPQ